MADMDRACTSSASHIRRGEQIKVFGGLAIATVSCASRSEAERDHLAPRERCTFSELCTGWARGRDELGRAFLGEEEAA